MEKTCLKCGTVGHTTGNTMDVCPHCGAIYTKVEAAMAEAPLRAKAPAAHAPRPKVRPNDDGGREAFVEQLRNESLYPTTRWWVNAVYKVVTVFCVVMCVIIAIGALMSSFMQVAWVVLFVLFWLFTKIATELSLMLVDLCDASVRTAYAQERYKDSR